ncbi:MAG: NADH oxidase [Rhodospirillaceae bacterium]|nr:NADH oxidase [Rhodospirillaceae bacterium]OUT79984.1 MAG: NADH oxidase [Rhodospirillaceae bacterium TMED23]
MWKPKDKIKYDPNPGKWPSKEEALASRWFSPIKIGSISLNARTWIPAMVPWRSTDDGIVTDRVLAWYERFAQGQPGCIVVEATGIRDVPSGPLLRIGHDRYIPGLKELSETVNRASSGKTKLFIQLIDFLSIRRRPDANKFFSRFLTITENHRNAIGQINWTDDQVRGFLSNCSDNDLDRILSTREIEDLRMGTRERVTDTELEHIRLLPEVLPSLFADAADRAKRAGLDGVELHYAHAYTMASFLSKKNTRDDGYGGKIESRVKLPLEVFQAVRDRVGDDYPVGCRFLSDECIDGGSTLEDARFFALEFANAGMDFISLSRGGKFEDAKQPPVGGAIYPYTGKSGYECMPAYISDAQGPFGRNIKPTSSIKKVINAKGFKTPIILAGGIHGFEIAEKLIQEGHADIVASARQSLADPDWFLKASLGKGGDIRLCTYSNYCEGLDQKHKIVTCKLWDREDLSDPNIQKSDDNKRRLIAPSWKIS